MNYAHHRSVYENPQVEEKTEPAPAEETKTEPAPAEETKSDDSASDRGSMPKGWSPE